MENTTFGEYIESIRKTGRKSLRKTAHAIGVSAQFYSDVEKGHRCAFTADKLELLKNFLEMTTEEANQMYDKAAASYSNKGNNVAVPQDFSSYIVDRSYVMSALRTLKKEDAGEQDWANMVEAFYKSKAKRDGESGHPGKASKIDEGRETNKDGQDERKGEEW